MAHGTTSCNRCSSATMFTYRPSAPGTYSVIANFSKSGYGVLATSASSFTVTSGTPSAALMAGSASVVAVALVTGTRHLWRRGGGRALKTPTSEF